MSEFAWRCVAAYRQSSGSQPSSAYLAGRGDGFLFFLSSNPMAIWGREFLHSNLFAQGAYALRARSHLSGFITSPTKSSITRMVFERICKRRKGVELSHAFQIVLAALVTAPILQVAAGARPFADSRSVFGACTRA